MKLARLIERYYQDANDEVEPRLRGRNWVIDRLNAAQAEAAIRARLLHEHANPALCQINVEPGTSGYALHPKLYELTYQAWARDGDTRRKPLPLVTAEDLDYDQPDWRERKGDPECIIQTDTTIRLVPQPETKGVVYLEGYRLPMTDMCRDDDVPEIHEAHHVYLVQWALFQSFSDPDVDFYDKDRAALALGEFVRFFGLRPDADLRRSTRQDLPHVTISAFP